jgi:hypothetical protein
MSIVRTEVETRAVAQDTRHLAKCPDFSTFLAPHINFEVVFLRKQTLNYAYGRQLEKCDLHAVQPDALRRRSSDRK